MTAEVYMSISDIARLCGVTQAAVQQWIRRFPDDVPQADVIIGHEPARPGWNPIRYRGWHPSRSEEWLKFYQARHPLVSGVGRDTAIAAVVAAGAGRDAAEALIDTVAQLKRTQSLPLTDGRVVTVHKAGRWSYTVMSS